MQVESSAKIVSSSEIKDESLSENIKEPEIQNAEIATELKPETRNPKLATNNVSALSISSIRAKKELLESQKGVIKEQVHFPTEAFTETEMLDFWFKYAQRLTDKGLMIMSSLLRISDPKLDGFKIIYELPNEGSKIDFEKEKGELLGYLRGHLHNHDISIEVIVNEGIKSKTAFTAIDKYNRLNEINPNLEVLKKMFDLDV
ncbi:DNA polymerase III subunit gamma/tau [Flavobacterium sp.]|uniref:DNA polymerase III subunit gamma/tau n=1 Tax=Flavobacterium sp. TaxID=239 RepID=UPI0037538C6B